VAAVTSDQYCSASNSDGGRTSAA